MTTLEHLDADRAGATPVPALGNDSLSGHLARSHPLSADAAIAGLAPAVRALLGNPGRDSSDRWDIETRQLPRALRALRRRARDFAQAELAPLALQVDALPHWPVGTMPDELHRLLATAGRAGWLSDFLPKPIGSGSPRTAGRPLAMTASLKVEEFSRACGGLMLLLSANMLGQVPLLLSANPGLIARRLVPGLRRNLAGNPYLFAFAITEPNAGSDVEEGHGAALGHPGVVAKRVTGGWLLTGRKVFISGGDIAEGFTVFAALDGEGYESWTCFFIERGTPGFRPVRTEMKMGMRASGAAELELTDVFVPDADVVGRLRGGWSLNRQTLNLSRIPVASMAVGFAQAACDIATEHALRPGPG
ncbi:MAG TPA: acyl-CoA dehydrogenase family protein, partial [Mycobacterium sp.]|nr:acyl-CoA dehydrogenase family protein [Mycobacterium sp.]